MEKLLEKFGSQSLYEILQVEKGVDIETLAKSFKRLVKENHPDKNKSPDAPIILDKIINAYAILKDSDIRKNYDLILESKEEKEVRFKEMTEERKKFYDELNKKKTENEENKKKQSEIKRKIEIEIEMIKQRIRLNEDIDDLIYGKEYQKAKVKTLDEKLNSNGIKIKWNEKGGYGVSKDTIISLFQEYGKVEEVVLRDSNKAYILFNSFKAVQNVLDTGYKNPILVKYFKVKKFNKEDLPEEKMDIDQIKDAVLDSNILNTIRNYKYNQNYEYKKQVAEEKKEKTDLFIPNKELLDKVDLNNFEEFEEMVMEKLRKKFSK